MSSRNRGVLLVVQSPIGIASLLQIYSNCLSKNEITILCLGSRGLHEYLEKLELKCNLLFVKPEAYSSGKFSYIYRLAQQRKFIKNFCLEWDEVYITSLYQDIYAISIANECIKNNIKIYLVKTDLSNLERYAKKCNIYKKLVVFFLSKVISIAIGLEVTLINLSGKYIYGYKNQESIPILDIQVTDSVYKNFGIEISGDSGENILLFESLGEDGSHYMNYRRRLEGLIEQLSKLGTVYIKPHPTYGASKFLENNLMYRFLNGSTPAAMINLKQFKMIVGIDSAALKEVRHHNVISVIDSFDFTDYTVKDSFKTYLQNEAPSKIKFISIEEIENYFNN